VGPAGLARAGPAEVDRLQGLAGDPGRLGRRHRTGEAAQVLADEAGQQLALLGQHARPGQTGRRPRADVGVVAMDDVAGRLRRQGGRGPLLGGQRVQQLAGQVLLGGQGPEHPGADQPGHGRVGPRNSGLADARPSAGTV
jgi:hypothetical protein